MVLRLDQLGGDNKRRDTFYHTLDVATYCAIGRVPTDPLGWGLVWSLISETLGDAERTCSFYKEDFKALSAKSWIIWLTLNIGCLPELIPHEFKEGWNSKFVQTFFFLFLFPIKVVMVWRVFAQGSAHRYSWVYFCSCKLWPGETCSLCKNPRAVTWKNISSVRQLVCRCQRLVVRRQASVRKSF